MVTFTASAKIALRKRMRNALDQASLGGDVTDIQALFRVRSP
jgi:hypothetical protein